MSKVDEFWPRERNDELMDKLRLKKGSFKIIHFGALGIANGADTIIETAKLMKDNDSVQFIFLGGGSTETRLKALCKSHELKNVLFFPKTPMKETSEIVNCCDASIISFKDLPILYTNSPNKLFDSLSAGKPIIVNSAGWTKDLVEEGQCGVYVDPNRPQDLVEKIIYLKNNAKLCEEMGRNARKLAIERYDKSILTSQFAQTVEQLTLT
ncbi:PEP-CTERM/exosortase A-associated glycosyltransferase [compost metagenome]